MEKGMIGMGTTTKPMITLYTRNGCHLCAKAKEVITELREEFDFNYQECDIDLSDEWTEKYGLMIPVVIVNEKEVQFGRLDKMSLFKTLTEIKEQNPLNFS
jgi:glutaredoxin